jgi:hypothetical protein
MAEYGSFVAAFFAMQQELPEIAKDSKADAGPRGIMHYANLKTVTDAAYPLLAKFGFMWSTQPTVDDSKPVLRYELTHISHTADNPQQRTGLYPIFGDNKPQALGAAITYARRYALCAVLGLTPDKEEDAEGKPVAGKVVTRKPKAEPKPPADPDQVPGVPLPGEPEGMITRNMQTAMFAMLGKLGFGGSDDESKAKARAEINRHLALAGAPQIEKSSSELTIGAARIVLDGLKKEVDLRSNGSDQPA